MPRRRHQLPASTQHISPTRKTTPAPPATQHPAPAVNAKADIAPAVETPNVQKPSSTAFVRADPNLGWVVFREDSTDLNFNQATINYSPEGQLSPDETRGADVVDTLQFLKDLSIAEKTKLLSGHSVELHFRTGSEDGSTALEPLAFLGEEFIRLFDWMNIVTHFDQPALEHTDIASSEFETFTKLTETINTNMVEPEINVVLVPYHELQTGHTFVASPFYKLQHKDWKLKYLDIWWSDFAYPRFVSKKMLAALDKEQLYLEARVQQKEHYEMTGALLADKEQFPSL